MEINFKNIKTQNIEGKENVVDISKDLGNTIYNETQDIGELELARKIYLQEKIDLTNEEVEIVKKFLEKYYKAFIKEAIYKIINPK